MSLNVAYKTGKRGKKETILVSNCFIRFAQFYYYLKDNSQFYQFCEVYKPEKNRGSVVSSVWLGRKDRICIPFQASKRSMKENISSAITSQYISGKNSEGK